MFGQKLHNILDKKNTIIIIIIAGVCLRFLFLLYISRFPLVGDANRYYQVALQFVGGEITIPYWPPGLSLYLSVFIKIFGDNILYSRIAMLLVFIVFALFTYLSAMQLTSRTVSNLLVLFFTLYPTFIYHSVEPFSQLPAATLLMIVIYVSILLYKQNSNLIAAILGALLGCLTLLRPSNLILLFAIPIFLSLKRRTLKNFIVPVLVGAFLVSLWIFRIYLVSGEFIFINTANARNLFIGNNPYTPMYKTWWFGSHDAGDVDVPEGYSTLDADIRDNTPIVQEQLYRQAALEHITARLDLFFIRSLSRIRAFFAFDTFSGATMIKNQQINKPLGLIMIFLDALFYIFSVYMAMIFFISPQNSSLRSYFRILLLIIIFAFAIPYWISFSHPTYHFPIVPLLALAGVLILNPQLKDFLSNLYPPHLLSRQRVIFLVLFLLFFAFIQLEWIWVMFLRVFQV